MALSNRSITQETLPLSVRQRGLFHPTDVWFEALNTPRAAFLSFPPKPKLADPIRGLFEGVVIGMLLPCVTRPIDKLQLIVNSSTEKMTWGKAVETIKNKPYKGIGSKMLTNTARCSIIFFTIPVAENFFLKHGFKPATGEAIAPAVGGAICGALMSPYTVLDQRFQATHANNWAEVWKNMPRAEFKKALPAAIRMGVLLDTAFWPIYSGWVSAVEKQLCMAKQQDSLTKLSEELVVGALAGALTMPFTFPIHALQTRLISNPSLSILKDYELAMTKTGLNVLREHYYRGFLTGLTRTVLAMSAVNGLKYISNYIYDHVNPSKCPAKLAPQQTFFKTVNPKDSQPQESATQTLLRLGSL